MKTYEIENTSPTVQEFKYLCESVGWSDFMNFEVVEASLKTLYTVSQSKRMNKWWAWGELLVMGQSISIYKI